MLNKGQSGALRKKLEHARERITDGRVGAARGILKAFIAQVESLVDEEIIAEEDGARLIAAAQALLDSLAP